MRVVLQRVSEAAVKVDGKVVGEISTGFLVLLGVEADDTEEDVEWLTKKVISMRIFNDESGLMNKSIEDINGRFLVISQFTLHAATKKGNRPSFIRAARPEQAIPLYEKFIRMLELQTNRPVEHGIFGADMKVSLVNDGPVTIVMDSKVKE
ncbi:MAG: D-aminoacyl-tRNA deacylase [Bacteroidota bacterium]